MRIAVGAVYQTVTRSRSRISYQRVASNSSGSTIIVTPFVSGAMIPYEVPVTQPGICGAPEDVVGMQVEHQAARDVMLEHRARARGRAPFGVPVVPLVKCSSAGSSGRSRRDRERGARRLEQLGQANECQAPVRRAVAIDQ